MDNHFAQAVEDVQSCSFRVSPGRTEPRREVSEWDLPPILHSRPRAVGTLESKGSSMIVKRPKFGIYCSTVFSLISDVNVSAADFQGSSQTPVPYLRT